MSCCDYDGDDDEENRRFVLGNALCPSNHLNLGVVESKDNEIRKLQLTPPFKGLNEQASVFLCPCRCHSKLFSEIVALIINFERALETDC